jgi:hypothetical protein
MPYIKIAKREKYKSTILELVNEIGDDHVKFEVFVTRLLNHFIRTDYNAEIINLDCVKVTHLTKSISTYLSMDMAGELNYVISAVYWGLMGEAKDVQPASYEKRTLFRSVLEIIKRRIPDSLVWAIPLGVISDVIDECYRMLTVDYEETKINQNGVLWNIDGDLI